jgi:precorrin-2 dehydrogenase/sirohydrochlorin ferrochelatase
VSYYPVFLDLEGRRAVVIGGGTIAERKVERLRRAGARLTVVAPEVTPGLADLARRGEIDWQPRRHRSGDLRGASLAIAATDDADAQRAVAAEAGDLGIPVNVVDVPELSTFIAPAILERGDLQIAVSTSGAAPALAARLRDRIGESLGPELDVVVEILGRVRRRLRGEARPAAERQRILKELAASDLPERVRLRDRRAIDRLLVDLGGSDMTLERLGVAID